MIIPLRDQILVSPDKGKSENKNGIIIPDSARQKQTFGIVKSIGSNVSQVEDGDRILYMKHSGIPVKDDDGKDYKLLPEREILCKIK